MLIEYSKNTENRGYRSGMRSAEHLALADTSPKLCHVIQRVTSVLFLTKYESPEEAPDQMPVWITWSQRGLHAFILPL